MSNKKRSIGTTGIPGGNLPIGIAYVVIPFGVDRNDFVKSCMQTNTLCIRGESGDFFKNVPVSDSMMSDVKFPEDVSQNGSVVVYVIIPKHNSPVVVSVLNLKNEVSSKTNEHQFNIKKARKNEGVGIEMDCDGSAFLGVSAVGESPKISIRLSSPEDRAEFEVISKGTVHVFSSGDIRIASKNRIGIEITDEQGSVLSHIRYNKNKSWEIFADSNGDGIPAVLGNNYKEQMEKIVDLIKDLNTAISAMTVSVLSPNSPSGPPINQAPFVNINAKLSNLRLEIKKALSDKTIIQ